MRPKICIPVIALLREGIIRQAEEIAALPVEMAEWRVDYFGGYDQEIESIIQEMKSCLAGKELIVTLRTEAEGGEANGSRFSYFDIVERIFRQGIADYVDMEVARDEERVKDICRRYEKSHTRGIGSYHNFSSTPTEEEIRARLIRAKECGCFAGKLACMPENREDVDRLLNATAAVKEVMPAFPLITMSMGVVGRPSRLYGGLYGSEVSFGCLEQTSAPGQIYYTDMKRTFDKIYSGKRHVFLIGFMGVGKSAVSKELSRRTGCPEIDTDARIEQEEGRSISQIFDREGEGYFRDLETTFLDELGALGPSIVSCGGGMALRELNVRKMQALGTVVYLTAKPETIWERVRSDSGRPLLKGIENADGIAALMEQRRPLYERAATITIPTDNREICDIAKDISERRMKKKAKK